MILLYLSALVKDILIILLIGVRVERLFNLVRNTIIYRRLRFILTAIEAIMIIMYNKINNTHNLLTINQNNQLTKSLLSDIKEGSSEDEDNEVFNLISDLDNNNNSNFLRYSSSSDLDFINNDSTL